jgi:hypothetical protein
MLRIVALILLTLVRPLPAKSESSISNGLRFKTAYKMSGSCDRLLTPIADYTHLCGENLFQLIYPSGRQSWVYIIKGKSLVSFSGIAESHSTAVGILDIDHITMATSQLSTTVAQSARGSCELRSPRPGVFVVKCIGRTAAGPFSASFVSDGSRPERQDF